MKVSIVKCESYKQEEVDQAVKEALKLISFKFRKGMKVLLKPNVLYAAPPEKAITTHPSILIALCKLLKGCEIYIGDSPGYANKDEAFKVSGISDVAEKFKTNLVNFNTTNLIVFKNDKNVFLKEVYFPKLIKEVDLIVNLPKLKTHGLMKYTGAIKNLYGFIPGGKKAYYHLMADSEEKFGQLLVELYRYVKPKLTIMDAVVGMEGFGPSAGNPKQTGLILASKDCLSLDIIASGIIGFKPEEIQTTKIAIEKGLYSHIEKIGSKDIRVKYKKARTLEKKLPRFIKRLIYKNRIRIDNKKCKKCYICYAHCPAKAIKKGEKLTIDNKKCIQCFCCHELCSHKAVRINNFLINLIGKIRSLK